jgi:hypothetical protein
MEIARVRAGRRQHQIAEAGQAHQRLGTGTEFDAQPGEFGKRTGDERGAGAFAQAHAVDDSASDGVDVLGGAAERDADEIIAGVGAEGGMAEAGLQPSGDASMGGDGNRRRQAFGGVVCKRRTRQDGRLAGARGFGEDFVNQLAGAAFDAFGANDQRRAGPRDLGQSGEGGAQMLGRRNHQQRFGGGGGGQIAGSGDGVGQRYAGQEQRILAIAGDRRDNLRLARPQPHGAAGTGGGEGQRGAPSAGADHPDGAVRRCRLCHSMSPETASPNPSRASSGESSA